MTSNLGQKVVEEASGSGEQQMATTSGGAGTSISSSDPVDNGPVNYTDVAGSEPFPYDGNFRGVSRGESALMNQTKGYKKSGPSEKGQFVANQLFKPLGLEKESDEDWERVSEASGS